MWKKNWGEGAHKHPFRQPGAHSEATPPKPSPRAQEGGKGADAAPWWMSLSLPNSEAKWCGVGQVPSPSSEVFCLFLFLAMPPSLWDVRSPTGYLWQWKHGVLTTELPGNSPGVSFSDQTFTTVWGWEWKNHPSRVFFGEVRWDVNEHFLSRKFDFSDISYAFPEGLIAGAGKAEAGGGWRMEKVVKRQLKQVVAS